MKKRNLPPNVKKTKKIRKTKKTKEGTEIKENCGAKENCKAKKNRGEVKTADATRGGVSSKGAPSGGERCVGVSNKGVSRGGGKNFKGLLSELGVGALGGFINGFFGGGGGMVIVPMLIGLLKYERKKAHASCIAVVLPMAAAGGLVYALGGKVDFIKLLPVGGGVLLGGITGALLLKKIKPELLNYVFCAIMALAGLKMLF